MATVQEFKPAAPFETVLWCARNTVQGHELHFEGMLADAFVMRRSVGYVYGLEGTDAGTWHRTEEVVGVGSIIGYDYIETADARRYLIITHEIPASREALAQMRRHIAYNRDYFEAKRAACGLRPVSA